MRTDCPRNPVLLGSNLYFIRWCICDEVMLASHPSFSFLSCEVAYMPRFFILCLIYFFKLLLTLKIYHSMHTYVCTHSPTHISTHTHLKRSKYKNIIPKYLKSSDGLWNIMSHTVTSSLFTLRHLITFLGGKGKLMSYLLKSTGCLQESGVCGIV